MINSENAAPYNHQLQMLWYLFTKNNHIDDLWSHRCKSYDKCKTTKYKETWDQIE